MVRQIEMALANCMQCPYFYEGKAIYEDEEVDDKVDLKCRHPYGKFETNIYEDIITWFNEQCPLPQKHIPLDPEFRIVNDEA
jgi:hypothetical protein